MVTDINPFASRFVRRDSLTIHYTSYGEGPPLLLLHGGGPGASGYSNYSRNIAAFSERFTTYVLDFPGWGQSSKNLDSLGAASSFMNGARAIKIFMDALSIDKADLVGNSFGGSAAYYMAMEHPARVGRIVAMGPGGAWLEGQGPTEGIRQLMAFYAGEGPTRAKMAAFLHNLLYDVSVLTEELIDERFAASNDPEIAANAPLRPRPGGAPARESFLSEDPRLKVLPHRCLLIWGLQDRINLVEGAERFRMVPDQDIILFARCGHWAQWEHPEKFNDLVMSFLSRS